MNVNKTIIFGDSPYGILGKRTPWTIFKAIIWLKWWGIRFWLAKYGLFVKKVRIEE